MVGLGLGCLVLVSSVEVVIGWLGGNRLVKGGAGEVVAWMGRFFHIYRYLPINECHPP